MLFGCYLTSEQISTIKMMRGDGVDDRCKMGRVKTVRALLDGAASLAIENHKGDRALTVAVYGEATELDNLLTQKTGSEIDAAGRVL
jgi:hypothetical protein